MIEDSKSKRSDGLPQTHNNEFHEIQKTRPVVLAILTALQDLPMVFFVEAL
jgi:hypothetical protein